MRETREHISYNSRDMKKTKIVCTIGPASSTEEKIEQLIKAGMDVARLNFSHGTQNEKKEQIEIIRKLRKKLKKPITIIADLQGPKLRIGQIDGQRIIQKEEEVTLTKDALENEFPTQLDLSRIVKEGERILLNDGLVELIVKEINGNKIKTIAKNEGWVSSFKGINIPDSDYNNNTFTQKDHSDLLFAINEGVDYIALSYVQEENDIKNVKSYIDSRKSPCKIIAKIEKKGAVQNLKEIIQAADGVMIARGDLALETSPSDVPIIQLEIIRIARMFQKPVIVATQMLESMIANPRPTRAETSDIANAVLYQVDAVMLSAESATGKYPVEAVKVMTDIIQKVEQSKEFKHSIQINWEDIEESSLKVNAVAATAASFAHRIHAEHLVVATTTGRMARIVSSFRPESKIIVTTNNEKLQYQMSLLWGAIPILVENKKNDTLFEKCVVKKILSLSLGKVQDKIIIVSADTIKMATIV